MSFHTPQVQGHVGSHLRCRMWCGIFNPYGHIFFFIFHSFIYVSLCFFLGCLPFFSFFQLPYNFCSCSLVHWLILLLKFYLSVLLIALTHFWWILPVWCLFCISSCLCELPILTYANISTCSVYLSTVFDLIPVLLYLSTCLFIAQLFFSYSCLFFLFSQVFKSFSLFIYISLVFFFLLLLSSFILQVIDLSQLFFIFLYIFFHSSRCFQWMLPNFASGMCLWRAFSLYRFSILCMCDLMLKGPVK